MYHPTSRIAAVVVISVMIMLVVMLVARKVTSSSHAQQSCPQPADVIILPEAERLRCEAEIAAAKVQVDATEMARIETAPRTYSTPTPLGPDYIAAHGTPVPRGVIPESEMFVQEYLPENLMDGLEALRPSNASSVWRAGATINSFNLYEEVDVYSGADSCGIGILVQRRSAEFPNAFYDCPDPHLGVITITGIDLKTHTAAFTNQRGRTGTFNYLTHAWHVP